MAAETQLIVIERKDALTVYSDPEGLDPLLAHARKEIDAFLAKGFTVATKKGRDEIKSFAYTVAQSKAALETVGKALADEIKLIPKKVDTNRKKIRDTLDAWRDEVRAPLTAWEEREDARKAAHCDRLNWLNTLATAPCAGFTAQSPIEDMRAELAKVSAVVIGPACEEFEVDYARGKDAALRAIASAISERERYEAEQAELARLRAAEAERQAEIQRQQEAAAAIERERLAKEREAAIAAEAAEAARLNAAEDARKELERVETEARHQREAAERREQQLKDEAVAAERRAAEAEERVKRELAETAEREATEAARIKAEEEATETHRAYRATVNRSLVVAIKDVIEAAEIDLTYVDARYLIGKAIVTAIAKGQVPGVSITY